MIKVKVARFYYQSIHIGSCTVADHSKSQDENEKTAKVYQINSLADKIDALSRSQEDLKALIIAQGQTYPTRTELALELEKRDNKIADLKKTIATYSRVVWIVASAVIPTIALSLWQLIINERNA